jgi:LPXTG-site transpeptidase (sortase) family protein
MKKLHNSIIALEILLITLSLIVIGFSNKTLSVESALALVPNMPTNTLLDSQIAKNTVQPYAAIQQAQQVIIADQPENGDPKATSESAAIESKPATIQTTTQVQPKTEPVAETPKAQPVNEADTINLSYSHVVIPAVGIDAPITWNVDGRDMNKYLPVLTNSIAHYDWTALPGNGGSTTLFGHSSYIKNLPNNFDEVFAPLFNLQNGDKVYVVYQNKLFTYEVYASQTIVPTNPEFISQDGPERVMLMTCAPLGSQKYRLLVYAKRI